MVSAVRLAVTVVSVSMLAACATLPSAIDKNAIHVVAFKSARLPSAFSWYVASSEHGWFDIRDESGWTRIEIMGSTTGVQIERIPEEKAFDDRRFGDRVHVIELFEGEQARALGKQILAKAAQYPLEKSYAAYPGPNSNTFIEWMSHEVPGLWLEQYGTAVGKDYPRNGWIDFGLTTTRTGLELETPFLGVQAGLKEGVELHLLCLTIGVGIWPPRLKLPFLPGLPWELAH